MFKRALFALALLAAFGSSVAQASSKRHFKLTAKIANITQSATFPAPGSSTTQAGFERGTIAGAGALVQFVKVTGHPAPTVYTLKGTSTNFYAHGTLRDRFTATATLQPDGSVIFVGKGRFTGGTDRFHGARGKFTFTAKSPPAIAGQNQVATAHLSGTISP